VRTAPELLGVPVPDTASYIRGWIQMVLAPNDLFAWNNKYSKYMNIYITRTFTFIFLLSTTTHSVHAGISKPWRGRLPRPVVVFSSHCVSHLISFPVQATLTLLVPASGTGTPFPQNGVPIHRVRTYSLSRVHDSAEYWQGECLAQGWWLRESKKSNKPSKPPRMLKMALKTAGFRHLLT
jgi:hypothetical protein